MQGAYFIIFQKLPKWRDANDGYTPTRVATWFGSKQSKRPADRSSIASYNSIQGIYFCYQISKFMGIEFNFDEDEFKKAFADAAETAFIEYINNEIGERELECDCGSRSFDVETWKNNNNEYEGAAICRNCNERIRLEIDTSDIDELR